MEACILTVPVNCVPGWAASGDASASDGVLAGMLATWLDDSVCSYVNK